MIAKKLKCPNCGGDNFDIYPEQNLSRLGGKWKIRCTECGIQADFVAPVVDAESALAFYENGFKPENVEAGTKEEPTKIYQSVSIPTDLIPGDNWVKREFTKNQIKDSGERTKFETGAVRDMHEGKGRCDLLPLKVVARFSQFNTDFNFHLLSILENFRKSGEVISLYHACNIVRDEFFHQKSETAILELAVHFEDGCKKYGENNWQKGIPVHSFIDSAIRHYLKHKRGDTDERHDRACLWNLVCAIWTVENKPELNDFNLKK